MFEIVFLGTSASAPSVRRGLAAQIVMYRQYRFLVDCGEGTQRQLLKSGLGFKRLDRILLTHGHLDHILGLGGLMSTFMRWEAIERMEIYGGRPTLGARAGFAVQSRAARRQTADATQVQRDQAGPSDARSAFRAFGVPGHASRRRGVLWIFVPRKISPPVPG